MSLDNLCTKKAISLMLGVLSRVVLLWNKICLLLLSCCGPDSLPSAYHFGPEEAQTS